MPSRDCPEFCQSIRDLASKAEKGAEDYLREAVEIARRQNAKSLELRAAMSLSRLW
jgi:hypothetical protein